MGTFFKPWRRKVGTLTLLLACVTMAAWGRSRDTADTVRFPKTQLTSTVFSSGPSGLGLSTVRHPLVGQSVELHSAPADPREYGPIPDNPNIIKSSYWLFRFIATKPDASGLPLFSTLVIPHLSIVIPLTLLSAWLLLTNPKTAGPPSVCAMNDRRRKRLKFPASDNIE